MRCSGSASASSRSARVTPRPQPGNPRPRLFRLTRDEAVINRLGFNNEGAEAVLRAAGGARRARAASSASISAPTRTAADRVADYVRRHRGVRAASSTISPSTSPRRTRPACATCSRQARSTTARARDRRARPRRPASRADAAPAQDRARPDAGELDDIAGSRARRRIDGMIVANTTIGAADLAARARDAARGGRPVRPAAVPARRRHPGGDLCAGRGRVPAGRRRRRRFRRAAFAKIAAGASLVQLYTRSGLPGSRAGRGILTALPTSLRRAGAASTTWLEPMPRSARTPRPGDGGRPWPAAVGENRPASAG